MSDSNEIRTSVLVIAMANSIHTARWLTQFENMKMDVILFPSTPSRNLHPKIQEMLLNKGEMTLQIAPMMRWAAYPLGILDLFCANLFRGGLLKKLIRSDAKFQVIHALELQHAGYLLLRASTALNNSLRVIISNWGSDIYWFQNFPRHRKKLVSLMNLATHYSCECRRDIDLAGDLGFTGTSFPVQPNAGAFSEDVFQAARDAPLPSARKLIMIKGYTGFVGRADLALQACESVSESLRGFEIVLYSSDFKSRKIARRLAKSDDLNITIYKKHQLSHEEMLSLFRRSRVYMGVSESDGISTSLLDSISSGCFPIQTSTSCADEWVSDGVSGLIVDFKNPKSIADALRLALTNNELVDDASRQNIQTAQTRLSGDSIGRDIAQFYTLA